MADTSCPPWCKSKHQPNERPYRVHTSHIGRTNLGDSDFDVSVFRFDRRRPMSRDWKISGPSISIGLGDEVGHDTGLDDLTPDQAAKLARIVEALGQAQLAELLNPAVKTIDGSSDDA